MGSFYCKGTRFTRGQPSHVKAVFKRMAVRHLRRRLCMEALLVSLAGHVKASEIPVPPKPEWKPYVSEGEVEELPLAPHLQNTTAEDEEPSDAVMFFVEETALVNARRDEESYWTGAVDVDEQLWLTDILGNPDSIYAPSQSRGSKELEECRFDDGLSAEAKKNAKDRKAQQCAERRREEREWYERRHRQRYGY